MQENASVQALSYDQSIFIFRETPFPFEQFVLVLFKKKNDPDTYQTRGKIVDKKKQIIRVFESDLFEIETILSLEGEGRKIIVDQSVAVAPSSSLTVDVIPTQFQGSGMLLDLATFELPNVSEMVLVIYKENHLFYPMLAQVQSTGLWLEEVVNISKIIGQKEILEKENRFQVQFTGLTSTVLKPSGFDVFSVEISDNNNQNQADWAEKIGVFLQGTSAYPPFPMIQRPLQREKDYFVLDPLIWKDFQDKDIKLIIDNEQVANFEKQQYIIDDEADFQAMVYDLKGNYQLKNAIVFSSKFKPILGFEGSLEGFNKKKELTLSQGFLFKEAGKIGLKNLILSFEGLAEGLLDQAAALDGEDLQIKTKGGTFTKNYFGYLAEKVDYLRLQRINILLDADLNIRSNGSGAVGLLVGFVGKSLQIDGVQVRARNKNISIFTLDRVSYFENNSAYAGGLIGEMRVSQAVLKNINLLNIRSISAEGGDASAAGGIIGFAVVDKRIEIDGLGIFIPNIKNPLKLFSISQIPKNSLTDKDQKSQLAGVGAFIGRLRGVGYASSFVNFDATKISWDICASEARVDGKDLPDQRKFFIGELSATLLENTICIIP